MPQTRSAALGAPTAANDASAPDAFVETVLREAGYRRCLILDGNVRDVFPNPQREHVLLPQLLLDHLTGMAIDGQACFTICGRWDQVDGLVFPDQVTRQAFQRALANPGDSSPRAARDRERSDEYDDDEGTQRRGSDAAATGATTLLRQPEEAFPAMRRVLGHAVERAAFVIDYSEHLVGSAGHLDETERQFLTVLVKAVSERPCLDNAGDDAMRPTGLLIIVTSNLAALPPSLYQGNPRTKVISVPRPDRPARLAFLRRHQRGLHVAEPVPAPGQPTHRYASCEPLLGQMADLADGLTLVDLQNLLALSQQLPADRLVNLYKLGDQRSPWEDLDPDRLEAVEEELKRRVVGQDHALRVVATMLIRAHMGLSGLQHSADRKKPRGNLFFVGPPGVGKTELAKATAAFLFGDESACIRFDMSEYSHEHDDQRLVGAPPSYVGFEQGGQLTNAVRQRPFCVLVFDEIEKAHPRVLDKFLQILEDGRLTDGRGETTYFSETLIIFTSNIGSDGADASVDRAAHESYFRERVTRFFSDPPRADGTGGIGRPELLGRLSANNIVVFDFIHDPDIHRRILRSKLVPLKSNLRERFGLETEVTDRCLDWLGTHGDAALGGRDIINAVERDLINPLSHFLFQRRHQLVSGRRLVADMPPRQDAIRLALQNEDQT